MERWKALEEKRRLGKTRKPLTPKQVIPRTTAGLGNEENEEIYD